MNESSLPEILNPEIQDFIQKNLKTDLQKLILKGTPFPKISIQELATQIEGKNRIEKKLPTWFSTSGIIFPLKLNLEQASSEIAAKYKATLIGKGDLLDLTGGFGVDDYYFASKAKQVYHCELNAQLSDLVKHNAKVLGIKNMKCIAGDSKDFLMKQEKIETIYIDPSRRAQSNRVFLFKDCEPNVTDHLDFYLKKAKRIIIKAAPMLDITAGINELKHVSEVHIVSVNNECKELLFVLEKTNLKEPKIFCALLHLNSTKVYPFSSIEERGLAIKSSKLKNYLYEPDAAILKAGFFKSVGEQFKVDKIHPNTHLYTSELPILDFPGKIFKIVKSINFNDFTTSKTIKKANVVTRNFNLKPEELKKKYKITDGGNDHLFFTTNYKDQKIVIQAERI
jgi:precorrin-6B methylase 2